MSENNQENHDLIDDVSSNNSELNDTSNAPENVSSDFGLSDAQLFENLIQRVPKERLLELFKSLIQDTDTQSLYASAHEEEEFPDQPPISDEEVKEFLASPSSSHSPEIDFKIKAYAPQAYDGIDPNKAEDFITDIKSMINDRNWNHKGSLCIKLFSMYLVGSAKRWYNALIDTSIRNKENLTFPVLLDNFIVRFGSTTRIQDAQNAISTPQRSVALKAHMNDFLNKLNYYNTICESSSVILDGQAVDTFLKTLNKRHIDQLIPHKIGIFNTTVEKLGSELLEADAKEQTVVLLHEASTALNRQHNSLYQKRRPMTELEKEDNKRFRRDQQEFVKKSSLIVCNRCRKPGHKSIDCPSRSQFDTDAPAPITCSFCGIRGHSVESCFKKNPSLKQSAPKKKAMFGAMYAKQTPKPIRVTAKINNSQFYVVVDSLCTYSLLTLHVASELNLNIISLQDNVSFTLGDKNELHACGLVESVSMIIDNHRERLSFIVVPDCVFPIILGMDWLTLHNPHIDFRTGSINFHPKYCHSCLESPVLQLALYDADTTSDKSETILVSILTHTPVPQFAVLLPLTSTATVDTDTVTTLQVSEPPLTEEELQKLPSCYHDLVQVFSKLESEKLPTHRPYDISIELMEGKSPTWGPIYNLSEDELVVLKAYIDEQLSKGFIRSSNSPCGAPVLFVRKKDGSLRLCVDYRQLNSITKKDRYPLPLIDNLLDRLKTAKIFTALDLRGAYNLIRVKKGDEWKTSFRTRYGQYEYLVMPFGLTNAPAVFQRLMNDIFQQYLDRFILIYLDDILIYSENEEQHIEHVRIVFELLLKNQLYCKFTKCEFHVDSVEFLGYIVSNNGLQMNPKKIEVILNWKQPTNRLEVMSFIGFANYYRRFIRDFAKIARPLHVLTKKESDFMWNESAAEAFQTLKHRFTTAPILVYADVNKVFVIETDASDFAVGCVLSQHDDENVLHPVAFYSKKLNDVERRWPVHDKELYGIVVAFRQWRQYLQGSRHQIIVYTDHRNLQYFMTKNLVNDRHIRWSLEFSKYDFIIHYKPGSTMGKADALSRQGEYNSEPRAKIQNMQLLPTSTFESIPANPRSTTLVAMQAMSKNALYELIASKTYTTRLWNDLIFNPELVDNYKEYAIRHGLIYRNDKIVVPDDELCKLRIVQMAHDHPTAGHLGIANTIELIKREFFCSGLAGFVAHFIKTCDLCNRSKARRHLPYGLLQPLPIPNHPWSSVSVDFVGPLPPSKGFDLILVVVDRMTKMAHFMPCVSTITAEDVFCLFRDNVMKLHGLPSSVLSDRDTLFTSKFWSDLTRLLKVDSIMSTAHHQQTNGQSERVIQRLKEYFRLYINYHQDDWLDYLALAEFTYNNARHSSIGISPFKANYGYDFSLELSPSLLERGRSSSGRDVHKLVNSIHDVHNRLLDCLKHSQELMKRNADKYRALQPDIKVGSKVWLKTTHLTTNRPSKKLDYKFIGPFEVLEQVNELSFKLKLPHTMKVHDVFHVSLLELYVESTLADREVPKPPPVVIADEQGHKHDEYVVEKVLAKRIRNKKPYYLIHWQGYGIGDRSWEPIENLQNAQEVISEFERTQKRPKN